MKRSKRSQSIGKPQPSTLELIPYAAYEEVRIIRAEGEAARVAGAK